MFSLFEAAAKWMCVQRAGTRPDTQRTGMHRNLGDLDSGLSGKNIGANPAD
ncbi:hypothetical protein [Hydrogenophaga sp.]|uniref:hypothetical protein n=1 Tax=Hydrogenophaga sp. TaxID=1904254 RepID=UPI003F6C4C53